MVVFHGARGLPRLEVHHFLRMRLQQVQTVQPLLCRLGIREQGSASGVQGSPARKAEEGRGSGGKEPVIPQQE